MIGTKTGGAPARDAREVPGEVGIWILIGGDLLVFTLFFVLIVLGNSEQPEVFVQSRAGLDIGLGVANTLLLVTGSFLVASGVENARRGRDRVAARFLCGGIVCGTGFVANKIVEWSHKIGAGLTPATNDFYMLFYVFTGIHLLHVVLGTVFLAVVLRACRKRQASPERNRLIETGGLFWHLVDLLWIILFALLYLI
jgi:nitric oxide reductase NorE protein